MSHTDERVELPFEALADVTANAFAETAILNESDAASYDFSCSAILIGDSRTVLATLPDESFQTTITSPPYWSLRDYEIDGQIGLEDSLDEYLSNLVAVFEQVRRVTRADGTLWLNLGDSYTSGGRTWRAPDRKNPVRAMDVRRRPQG